MLLPQGLAAPATPQVLEEIAAKVAAAEAARAAAVAEVGGSSRSSTTILKTMRGAQ